MKKLKMITESNYDVKVEKDNKKNLYIEGLFALAETKNENGRVYPKGLLEREIDKVKNTSVKNKSCLGELEHPTNRSQTLLERAAIMIESLEWDNNNVYGRAKVLENTPSGYILKGLLDSDVRIGISSRGLGETRYDESRKCEVVTDSYNLLCWDCVQSPSTPGAFVNGILEGKEFPIYNEKEEKPKSPTDEQIRQALKEHEKNILNFFNSLLNEGKDEILGDPLYKKVINAKTDAERAKALETLRSIRGESAVVTLINYLKNKK